MAPSAASSPRLATQRDIDEVFIKRLQDKIPQHGVRVQTAAGEAEKNLETLMAIAREVFTGEDHPRLKELIELEAKARREVAHLPPTYHHIQNVERPGKFIRRLENMELELHKLAEHFLLMMKVLIAPGQQIDRIAQSIGKVKDHLSGNAHNEKKRGRNGANTYRPLGRKLSQYAIDAEERKLEDTKIDRGHLEKKLRELEKHQEQIRAKIVEGDIDGIVAHPSNDQRFPSFAELRNRIEETIRAIDRAPHSEDYRQYFAELYRCCTETAESQALLQQRSRHEHKPPTAYEALHASLLEGAKMISSLVEAMYTEEAKLPHQLKIPQPASMSTEELTEMDWHKFFSDLLSKFDSECTGILKRHGKQKKERDEILQIRAVIYEKAQTCAKQDFSKLMDLLDEYCKETGGNERCTEEQKRQVVSSLAGLYGRRSAQIIHERTRIGPRAREVQQPMPNKKPYVQHPFSRTSADFEHESQTMYANMASTAEGLSIREFQGSLARDLRRKIILRHPIQSLVHNTQKMWGRWRKKKG